MIILVMVFITLRIFLDQKPNLATFEGGGWLWGGSACRESGQGPFFELFIILKQKKMYEIFQKNHLSKPITFLEK